MGIIGAFGKTLAFLLVWAGLFFLNGSDSIYAGAISGIMADPNTETWVKLILQIIPAIVFLSILYRFMQELSLPSYSGAGMQ